MSTPHDHLPPHYRVLRQVWTALQLVLLLVVLVLLVRALPPGELIGHVRDLVR